MRCSFIMVTLILALLGVAQGYGHKGHQAWPLPTLDAFVGNLDRPIRSTRPCPQQIDDPSNDGTQLGYLTRLQQAASTGDLDQVKHLIRDCGASVDATVPNKYGPAPGAPIHQAAQNGHPGVISFLIESGADPDKKMARLSTKCAIGYSAIHLAVLYNDDPIPVLRALLDGGADRQLKTNGCYAVTAAELADNGGKLPTKEFLDTYKPLKPMECLKNTMNRVTEQDVQQVLQNASSFRALLTLVRGHFDLCHL